MLHFITILEITSTACVCVADVRRQTQQEDNYLKCALCGLAMFILGVIYFHSTHSAPTHTHTPTDNFWVQVQQKPQQKTEL